MITKEGLEKLATTRLEDALVLHKVNRCSAAYYLAGYSVELSLKACIAKLVQAQTIPDKAFVNAIYVHRLEALLNLSGLRAEFDAACKANPDLAASWAIVNNWSEDSRYEMWDPFATASLLQAIHDPKNGVFPWLKTHW